MSSRILQQWLFLGMANLILGCCLIHDIKRPVIYMHGLKNNPKEMEFPVAYIQQRFPGIQVYPIYLFNQLKSFISLDRQIEQILPYMQEIMNNHTKTGVTLFCYSQGGVICRAAVEMLSGHNVVTFIVLSSPLAGQYGVTSFLAPYLPTHDRSLVWRFLYTKAGQEVSIGSYWNDPHHQNEFSDPNLGVLLAVLNNQTGNPNSTIYKSNFLKLSQLVLIGGPNDTVITPWQSAHFGYYDEQDNVLPKEKQPWYINDDFGLRTLNEEGRVRTHTIPGVEHTSWYMNKHVFDCCILPYL